MNPSFSFRVQASIIDGQKIVKLQSEDFQRENWHTFESEEELRRFVLNLFEDHFKFFRDEA